MAKTPAVWITGTDATITTANSGVSRKEQDATVRKFQDGTTRKLQPNVIVPKTPAIWADA